MISKWSIIILCCIITINCEEDLDVIMKTRSPSLDKYTQYSDVTMMRFVIPKDTLFASFKFVAEEHDESIFGCSPRDISVYMKQGAPPVINPDGTKFPKSFKNITRSPLFNLTFKSDKSEHYINITSPVPGSYYVAGFVAYTDPRNNAIKQQGLSSDCFSSMDGTLYIKKINSTKVAIDNKSFSFSARGKENIFYRIFVPNLMDYAIVTMIKIVFSKSMTKLNFYAQEQHIPSKKRSIKQTIIPSDNQPALAKFEVEENTDLYLQFQFDNEFENNTQLDDVSSLEFSVRFFSNEISETDILKVDNNSTFIPKLHYSSNITEIIPYTQFNLVREASTDSLLFSYELESELLLARPVPINLTNHEYVALKFSVADLSEIGGTLQYILAFKPKVKKVSGKRIYTPEPENHVIIACINKESKLVPQWPDKCVHDGVETKSPLIINKDDKNATMLIPFPENGIWYATFRLFCGKCDACNCSKTCESEYEQCVDNCSINCQPDASCNSCVIECKKKVIAKDNCKGCDCNGGCQNSTESCNSSVIFDVSSQSCIQGECGKNGRCMLIVSDGVVISSCVCDNRYRGWDCSDNSLATPYWMVLLELLLLVLSNLAFLPAVYVAFRRKYYVESVCYFAICFFSTFYHSCDAGENLIDFCITRLASLQFADFYCALLAIWVTLIAIADLPDVFPPICQITGSIIIAFCTTINKTALWIFFLPAVGGISIILVSWYLKYRKYRRMFIRKQYLYINLLIGCVLVIIGLIIYTTLQTKDNYKYLHSMWHMIMAIALLVLLPTNKTFLPEPVL